MVFPEEDSSGEKQEKQILLNKLCIYHLLKKDYYILSKKYNNFFVSGLIDGDGGFSLSFRTTLSSVPLFGDTKREETQSSPLKEVLRTREGECDKEIQTKESLYTESYTSVKSIPSSFYFSQEGKFLKLFLFILTVYSIKEYYHRFIISDHKTLINKVIPFFDKYK